MIQKLLAWIRDIPPDPDGIREKLAMSIAASNGLMAVGGGMCDVFAGVRLNECQGNCRDTTHRAERLPRMAFLETEWL